jgi:cell wall-associated NlpC family hydrolase
MIWTPERQKAALEECARWHGVRHVNRIAVPGVGIDCIQLVWRIYSAASVVPEGSVAPYSVSEGMVSPSRKLRDVLNDLLHCEEHDPGSPEFGDVVLFKTGGVSAHCGFLAGEVVWHALARRCVTPSPWLLWRHKADTLLRVTKTGFRGEPRSIILKHER